MGMVPIENAVAGSVAGSYELLMDHDLTIFAEVILRVHHMLLGIPGAQLSGIKKVRSHPQALAQCQRYITRRGLQPDPAADTAGSGQELAARASSPAGRGNRGIEPEEGFHEPGIGELLDAHDETVAHGHPVHDDLDVVPLAEPAEAVHAHRHAALHALHDHQHRRSACRP